MRVIITSASRRGRTTTRVAVAARLDVSKCRSRRGYLPLRSVVRSSISVMTSIMITLLLVCFVNENDHEVADQVPNEFDHDVTPVMRPRRAARVEFNPCQKAETALPSEAPMT